MSITSNNLKVREVINQVVNDPEYKQVSSVPLFSWPQITVIAASYIGVIGSIYLYLYHGVSLWLLYPVMIAGFYMSFTPLHDATHRAVSSNKFLNDLLGTISGTILFPFVTTNVYRFLHLAHHRYVGDKEWDPDEGFVDIPTKYFPFGYLILLFPDFLWVHWLFFKAWKRTPTLTRVSTIAMFAAFFIMNGVMFSGPYAYEYAVLFLMPNRLGIAYITYSFAHIQHPEGLKWHDFPFQTTFKLIGNSHFLKTFLGQADHAMHHFMPHVPWYKYHKVWDLANGAFRFQNVPERTVFSMPDVEYKHRVKAQKETEVLKISVKVASILDAAKGVKSFIFAPLADDTDLPPFTAGAHIDIHLPSGKIRSYSLVNPPFDRSKYQIAVKYEANGKGGSKEMHEEITEGDTLDISVPRNNFLLYENVQKYILISGGIGITPMLSMAHQLTELEKHFELHICAKSLEEVPFQFELENWSFAPNVEVHLDKQGRSSIDLSKVLAAPKDDSLIYVCGPSGFNDWISETAISKGWSTDQVKQEVFSNTTQQLLAPKPFELVLARRNKSITVKEDETIIDALQHNKIKVPYSCLQGTCGTCVTHVVEGAIDHRDAVLSREEKSEGERICLCVSRAKEDRLVIDL